MKPNNICIYNLKKNTEEYMIKKRAHSIYILYILRASRSR